MMNRVRAGLIAAGTGSRFRDAGFRQPKPMINVAGKPLMGWALSQFQAAGLNSLIAIFNTKNCEACSSYLSASFPQIEADIRCLDTASSFESFLNVLSRAEGARLLITTTDSIYAPGTLARLLKFADSLNEDEMILGVTDFIDDEKPLYAIMDDTGCITRVGEEPAHYVTSGVYLMPPAAYQAGKTENFPALRKFLAFLLENGVKCRGFDMGKSVDVDRPEDMGEAERFISTFKLPS